MSILDKAPRLIEKAPRLIEKAPTLSSSPTRRVRKPLRRYRRGLAAASLGGRAVVRAARLGAKAGERRVQIATAPARASRVATGATAALGGAAAMYFLDAHSGRRRRHVARDRALKLLRRSAREAERKARYRRGVAAGRRYEATHAEQHKPPPDDTTLAQKVESEIFRDEHAPKGTVNVNAERGIVYLRGYTPDQEWIDRLIVYTEGVEGVTGVRSLLHVAGAPDAGGGTPDVREG